MPRKQIHLAAHFPGVNNTTVWSDPAAGSHIEFSSFAHFARTAERGKFDFLFLAEGLRLREQNGLIYDLDVVGPPRHVHRARRARRRHRPARPHRHDQLDVQRALRGRPPVRVAGPPVGGPRRLERRHLVGRVHRRELPPRRLPGAGRPLRRGRGSSSRPPRVLFDSWQGDEIVADAGAGHVPAPTATPAGSRALDDQFDIAGQFNVPRSPQGRPVILQAGDSDEGREFAAADADAIFTRHGTLEAGRAFYADVKGRLARYGRDPDDLQDPAGGDLRARRHRRRGAGEGPRDPPPAGQRADRDQVRSSSCGTATCPTTTRTARCPTIDPIVGENTIAKGRASVRHAPRPGRDRERVAGARRGEEPVAPRAGHRGDRPAVLHRLAGDGRRGDRRVRAARRVRRLHPRPAHHPGRPRRLRRQGRPAAAGARRRSAPSTRAPRCASTSAWRRRGSPAGVSPDPGCTSSSTGSPEPSRRPGDPHPQGRLDLDRRPGRDGPRSSGPTNGRSARCGRAGPFVRTAHQPARLALPRRDPRPGGRRRRPRTRATSLVQLPARQLVLPAVAPDVPRWRSSCRPVLPATTPTGRCPTGTP